MVSPYFLVIYYSICGKGLPQPVPGIKKIQRSR
jgi:hypothetical protein